MATYVADHVSIDPRAEIDDDVEIGPFCVIGPHARIGRGTRLENSVTLMGRVTIGQHNHLFPGVVIGFMVIMLAGRQGLIGDITLLLFGEKLVFAFSYKKPFFSIGNFKLS